MKDCNAIVIGTSSGGLNALSKVLKPLARDFPVPILIVQHISPDANDFMVHHLRKNSNLQIKEADDKDIPEKGWVYIAPPNYHMLVEEERFLSLAVTPPENFSRPSIDVLFETAADAYTTHLIGIILTGANNDGTKGAIRIKDRKGMIIAQSPETAEATMMPQSVIDKNAADIILPLDQIGKYLNTLILGTSYE
ncbi:MAG: chemotaxis protein CheB [Spirochaetaceae bacterium 4572_59]|nr:MAG: chemotaxis protein CheB [Spirochaetaceae bacterium 4572_59]